MATLTLSFSQTFFSNIPLLTRFPPVRPFLAPHLRTDWLSQLELGNLVGATTDHLKLLPTQHTERSKSSSQTLEMSKDSFFAEKRQMKFTDK